jgi:hypothetical protein
MFGPLATLTSPIKKYQTLISLRLLALILCSNCSNLINIKFGVIDPTMLNYFLKPGGSLVLAQHPPRMVLAFHSPP